MVAGAAASTTPTLPAAQLEGIAGVLAGWDVTVEADDRCGGYSPANNNSNTPIRPTSLPRALPTTSGLVLPESSRCCNSNSVSFSINSTAHPYMHAGLLDAPADIKTPPSSSLYSNIIEPTSPNQASSKPPGKPLRQQQQSSTFNAKFRVHSRHRSIGKLDELNIEPAVSMVARDDNEQFHSLVADKHSSQQQQPVKSLLVGCATTTTTAQHNQSPIADVRETLSSSIKSSAATNEKLAPIKNIFIYRNNNHCNKRSGNNKLVRANKYTSKSIPNQLNTSSTLEFKREDNEYIGNMSQTLQSIHSLSMQLNQAASLSGSGQLDDELDPHNMMTLGSRAGASTRASGKLMSGGSKFSRLVGKKASRVKEILLQNLGKADKTTDDLFKLYEENFYRQQSQALKLQKEFKSYVNALKGAHEAGKSLNACIQQSTGDYQSARHDLVCENLTHLDHLDEDLMEKLRNQILVSVSEYLSQFNDLRDKIAKRRRKLIDFDSSRRVYELVLAQVNKKRQHAADSSAGSRSFRSALTLSGGPSSGGGAQSAMDDGCLQSATSQLVDEARLLKLREQYNYCKIMYETINSELHDELPMVYEKKMKNLLMTLQNYFSLEAQFHSNAGKLFATASDVIDELPMANLQRDVHSRHSQMSPAHKSAIINGEEYNSSKTLASGSSGMGSSGGESSIESSSSLNASGNGSPTVQLDEHLHPASSGAVGNGNDQDQETEADCEQAVAQDGDHDDEEEEVVYEEDVVVEEDLGEVGDNSNESSEDAQLPGKDYGLGDGDDGDAAGQSRVSPSPPAAYASAVLAAHHQPHRPPGQADPLASGAVVANEVVVTESIANAGSDYGADLEAPLQSELAVVAAGEFQLRDQEAEKVAAAAAAAAEQADQQGENAQPEAAGEERRCLYKVKTSYKYLAEDVDELCFEADEIIQVIEFDEHQEQEEGWLMGVREVNGQRGLFPANFTRPV